MKAALKKHASKLATLKGKIADEEESAAKLQADLSASRTRIKHLRAEVAELESTAASEGFAVSELHEASDQ
jgi:septal ring factor EnvC (AmiA/AmiB activator)